MAATSIITKVMTITPDLARSWLSSSNIENREVKQRTVEKYAGRIMAGEWIIVDQLISFDVNGRLQNGQHRLMAVVKTGKNIEALVGFGFPEETYKYLDQGHNRSKGDIHKASKKMVALVSATAKTIENNKLTNYTEFENVRNYLVGKHFGDGITTEDLLGSLAQTNAKVLTSGGALTCFVYWCDRTGNFEYLTNLYNEAVLGWKSLERQRTVSARTLSLFQSIRDRKVGTWNSAEVVRKFFSFYNPDKRDSKRIPEASPSEIEVLRSWAKNVLAGEYSFFDSSNSPLQKIFTNQSMISKSVL